MAHPLARRQALRDALPPRTCRILARLHQQARIADDRKGRLFRTSPRHNATVLTDQPMTQADVWCMIHRRAAAAGIMAPIENHSFRATGITAYLEHGGALEHAQSMGGARNPRTTKLYGCTKERLTQNEVEMIRLLTAFMFDPA
jgi:site-specific recombinase XerD